MKKKYLIPLLAAGLISLLFFNCKDNANSGGQANRPPASFPVAVLQPKTITGFESYPTHIEGIVSSAVRAKVSGYVKNVLVDEGQPVRKGQTLFKLETQALSQDADAAKARVNVAQVEVDKIKPLVDQNIISAVQLETAKANLAQAKANYNSIIANIDYATVKSPVDGYVGTINFRQGALIGPNDPTPLTMVSDISQVYAFFSMNEISYLDFLQKTPGKTLDEKIKNFPKVQLILANGETYSEEGTIQTASAQLNNETGTVNFRAVFDNPNQLLTNGNSGTIRIPTTYKDAVVIPQAATFEEQNKILVYKLKPDNTVSAAVIKVKADIDNLYVVASGLKNSDTIVANGVGKLRSEMPITPQQTAYDSIVKPIKTLFRN
ncbi:efflux RND transporter periplasmic adaptor subunit [Gaetbulibacter aestuarii]|uniref:Efflux RND transporter periplasmic adaptor subunit n=1 Tax=Gaetbulibacter aestuarii TaxID=1502358 RepID=A0ABW7MVB9_9FLAO